ncbi:single-stranded DNA-binding protein [Clostridium sp.]|jgi:single-strand DNA-binding protein|uniref:single-stranded DNA-binding protein n=1 Tax=Clostridium sp. TaxID=1506 RepID=UPI0039F5BBCC
MNKVMFIGRITKDIEVKRLKDSDKCVTAFSLAVEREFPGANGEKLVDFIPVVAWNKDAEFLSRYAKKGSRICVMGRLEVRSYETKDGERRYMTQAVAQGIQLLDTKILKEENVEAI